MVGEFGYMANKFLATLMQIGSKEHCEILEAFEKNYPWLRLDKEDRKIWKDGNIYQNGETNNLYKAFISGYSFTRVVYL